MDTGHLPSEQQAITYRRSVESPLSRNGRVQTLTEALYTMPLR